jgi:hypothetical protein
MTGLFVEKSTRLMQILGVYLEFPEHCVAPCSKYRGRFL